MTLLAIESSCDETAITILGSDGQILAEHIHSQQEHSLRGGVIPEIAARAHSVILPQLLDTSLQTAGLKIEDINYYAATIGPGLIGGLLVGSVYAKSLAFQYNKKFIGVNHLEGHALSPFIEHDISYPYLLLLISGGHCQILSVHDIGQYTLYGQTIDDSVGEAFDKASRILGGPYPGGPYIEQLAQKGDAHNVPLPRPLTQHKNCNFSFSGLKTATLHAYQKNCYAKEDIAASFQLAVSEVLSDRVKNACIQYKKQHDNNILCVAGGVAANKMIQQHLQNCAQQHDMHIFAPSPRYCTDNATMIATVAYQKMRKNDFSPLNIPAQPRMPLWQETIASNAHG